MPASEFAQKQVGVMARIADVVQNCRATQLAGIVNNQIAKAEQSLRNTGGNGDILNLAEGNIASGARYQTGINFDFRVGQSVANHVSSQVVIGGNQQQREGQQDRDVRAAQESAPAGKPEQLPPSTASAYPSLMKIIVGRTVNMTASRSSSGAM